MSEIYENNFIELSQFKILRVITVEYMDDKVMAILEVSNFNRSTIKPYRFSHKDWRRIEKRGYIDVY